MIGCQVSHFYIIRQLGSGGMGVVYEAQDTRLPRSVAIKFLKSTLSMNSDALRRFKREAQLASSLNHPNICTILDVDEADGQSFIAMELLRGRSLKSRLSGEPLPFSEIIDIAGQVADALAAAHDQGIMHRDIAPGNVFLTESGLVKLLDFGLAKHFSILEADGQTTDDLTAPGAAAGTLAYMAPEQLAEDASVDSRSDLYSLGILLYQMTTGARPFDVAPRNVLVSAIQSQAHVPVRTLRPQVPAGLERIIDKLLAKRPEDRYQTAHALRTDLDGLRSELEGFTSPARDVAAYLGRRNRTARSEGPLSASHRGPVRLTLGAAAVAGIAVVTWTALHAFRAPAAGPSRFVVRGLIDASVGSAVTITPDGRTLVYTGSLEAGRPIMLLPIGQLGARALAGTEGGNKPSIAPTGRRVAFFSRDDKLKIMPIAGGSATDVWDDWRFGDAVWDGDSAILTDGFRKVERGLSRRALDGGGRAPVVLTRPDTARGEVTHAAPLMIPGTRAVVFTVVNTLGAGPGPRSGQLAIALLDQRGGSPSPHVPLGVSARRAIAVVDHWLLYTSEDGGAIMAVRLDVEHRRVFGARVSVLEDSSANMETASLAANGTLLYVRRSRVNSPVLVDAKGAMQPLLAGHEGPFMNPRFSPDGKRFAVQVTSAHGTDVSVYDIASRTRTRLTTTGMANQPTWTPDGRRIVFWSVNGGAVEFWSQPADGAAPALKVVTADRAYAPTVTPDGRSLLFQQPIDSGWRIWSAPLSGQRAARQVLDDPSTNYMPAVSPDGKWLAYVSRLSRREEIFVRAFPGLGAPVQVSDSGGTEPAWSPDGRRIYYRDKRWLMAALVTAPSLAIAARERLFEGAFDGEMAHRNYDVSPDGKHFLMIAADSAANPEAVVVLNWLPELRARLSAARE